MIYKFGYKIKEKIDAELKPDFGEPTQVFDLFEGKNFELIITRQGDYNNYDKSKFSASRSAIAIDGEPVERTKESMSQIKEELDCAPSLSVYEYRAWDGETRDFVNSVLKMYLNPGDAISEISTSAAPKKSAPKKEAPKKEKVAEPAGSNESSSAAEVSSDDDLDSFLDDLDI